MAGEDGPPGDALTPRQFAEWAQRNQDEGGAATRPQDTAAPTRSKPAANGAPGSTRTESLYTRLTRERFDDALNSWEGPDDLKQFYTDVFNESARWNFFALLRATQALSTEDPRIGDSITPKKEHLRLGQYPSIAFARVSVQELQPASRGRPPRIACNHFGLLGPNGPMPLEFSEYVRSRSASRDRTLEAFLDIFHHRMMSLFFKAWAIVQPTVEFDRPDDDRIAEYIGSLIGIGAPPFAERDSVADLAKLHYAGHLSNHTKHAEGLQSLIGDFFGVPCRLDQFIGQWVDLPIENHCVLGGNPKAASLNGNSVVGSKIWDVTQRFRLILGPMSLERFEKFLPGGSSFPRMVDWVKNYVGWEFRWDAQLILAKEEIPSTQLGGGARLGWTTWLKTTPMDADADHLILRPEVADPTQAVS